MKTVNYYSVNNYEGLERGKILNIENKKLFSEYLLLEELSSNATSVALFESEKELISHKIEKIKEEIEKYKNLLGNEDVKDSSFRELKIYLEFMIYRKNKLEDILSRYDHI